MPDDFRFDVFLSHSSKDKPVVRDIAERLKKDGVKVWFDEWELKPGDSIPAKIEEGLERSRVLVLCMSANAFGSDWAQLESGTFRFRDPLNKEQRFIPLRLDDAPIKGSLAQFLHLKWSLDEGEREYERLYEACSASRGTRGASEPNEITVGKVRTSYQVSTISTATAIAVSPNGKYALVGTGMCSICLVHLEESRVIHLFPNLKESARHIVWSSDLSKALVVLESEAVLLDVFHNRVIADHRKGFGTAKQMVFFRLMGIGVSGVNTERFLGLHGLTVWRHSFSLRKNLGIHTMDQLRELADKLYQRQSQGVLAWPNGLVWLSAWKRETLAALASKTVQRLKLRLCSMDWRYSGENPLLIEGPPWVFAWNNTKRFAVRGREDGTLQLWNLRSGMCEHVFEGHTDAILSVSWHPKSNLVISGSQDKTIRVWNIGARRCAAIIKLHDAPVIHVSWHHEGKLAFSADVRGRIISFEITSDLARLALTGGGVSELPLQVQYTNAKVLLVGESSAGKTGLSNYLAHGVKVDESRPIPSTDGAWATHWPIKHGHRNADEEREIWLWDFAGQVDYRLVHQLHMEDAAAAVVVFDPQKENLFDGLGRWDRDIQKATRRSVTKLLAAGRADRGGLVVSSASVKKFMKERGFFGALHVTSAKTGDGCDQLQAAIVRAIDWKSITKTTSPALYRRLKQEILHLRDNGLTLIRQAELKQRIEIALRGENFELAELDAVVKLLESAGMIQRLHFGGFILLRPEVLSRYAAAVVRQVRKHPQELGCIREDELLAGKLDYQDFKRLERKEEEEVVLRAMLELFVSRAWCLRQPCDGTAMLTFPSYFRRERPEQPSHPSVLVTYRFDGPVDDLYATLVVRLHHTIAFQSTDLWKSAADFKTQTGAKLGFTLEREEEGRSRLAVYFEPNVDENSRVLFLRYVHEHLTQHARNVIRLRHFACGNKRCDSFGEQFTNHAKIDKALAEGGKGKVFCPDCGKPINLRDTIENKFEAPQTQEQVQAMAGEAKVEIDNESRELILVGHAFSIVAEAGQIYRGYTNSDHGIDGEIEFKDDKGNASGKRLYIQLKSGDSNLKKRKKDGAEVFQIKNERWADYWKQQACDVMLVIRSSNGDIRWMNVTASLKRISAGGKKVAQIVFDGDRFDALSVHNWRRKILGGGQ